MPRPKRNDKPEKLNLNVAKRTKQRAFALATDRKTSISRLFEFLIEEEDARQKRKATA